MKRGGRRRKRWTDRCRVLLSSLFWLRIGVFKPVSGKFAQWLKAQACFQTPLDMGILNCRKSVFLMWEWAKILLLRDDICTCMYRNAVSEWQNMINAPVGYRRDSDYSSIAFIYSLTPLDFWKLLTISFFLNCFVYIAE